ncbi:MAG: RnfABCDGE type electron transport complex subunit D [Planctomycetes bacterium]|nr:RnfABCDGE type electron transport complex subunit D [Planctomycetota bacterium]
MTQADKTNPAPLPQARWRPTAAESPFCRAPEAVSTIYSVTIAAACLPLLAGVVFFGWRAAVTAGIAVLSCVLIESLYDRVTRWPALLGRTHAVLTGLLLALTLPPFSPWYVPVIASAFAVIIGKAIFGGVGHFLWQPALVGRLAVAVIFPLAMNTSPAAPASTSGIWPVLSQNSLVKGDINRVTMVESYHRWTGTKAPGADGFLIRPPGRTLAGLTRTDKPEFSAIAEVPWQMPRAKPAALMTLQPLDEIIYGARPGAIGETCIIAILIGGLYLIYRNYVKWQLPFAIIVSAVAVAAVAPIQLAGPRDSTVWTWWPLLTDEGTEAGISYVCYQLFSWELLLTAFFLAPEMTSRPVTAGGQVIFGVGVGATAMLLKLYVDTSIPACLAVLAMNTLSPTIDMLWRPRVLGQRRFWFGK